jgi:hypothetical protein
MKEHLEKEEEDIAGHALQATQHQRGRGSKLIGVTPGKEN